MRLLPMPHIVSGCGFSPDQLKKEGPTMKLLGVNQSQKIKKSRLNASADGHHYYLSRESRFAFTFFILPCSWIDVRTPKTSCLKKYKNGKAMKVSKMERGF